MPTNPDINPRRQASLLSKYPALKRLSSAERAKVLRQIPKLLKLLSKKS